MTDETLEKGLSIKREMKEVKDTLYQLSEKPNHKKTKLRIARDSTDKEIKAYVFEDNNTVGVDIYFDDGLIQCIRGYFEVKLAQLEKEYENL